jgi:hypothetical protein
MDLILHLKGEFFDQIKAGTKTVEYRLVKPYWHNRLIGRFYDRIILARAYPKLDDPDLTLIRPWRGAGRARITHPHFGPNPVDVYAIPVHP